MPLTAEQKAALGEEFVNTLETELKNIGDDTKKLVEDVNKGVVQLRSKVDDLDKKMGELDYLDEAEMAKRSNEIAEKQNILDEKLAKQNEEFQKKLDEFKTALNRPGQGASGEEVSGLVKEHELLQRHALAVQGNAVNAVIQPGDAEAMKFYKSTFDMYMRKGKDTMTSDQQKALQVGSDPDGGILVDPTMSNSILERVFELDPIRQLANIEVIGTDAFETFVDWEEADDGWAQELVANDPTGTPQWQKLRIPTFFQEARPVSSQQVLDDANRNLEAWLANKVGRRFARTEGAAFVSGNGIDRPKGFLSYDATTTNDPDAEFGKIEQVALGAAAAITSDGLIDLKYAMVEDMLDAGTWLMQRATVAEIMKLKDGNGQYLWQPGLTAGAPSMILGLSLRMSRSMPAVAANALAVALADWREAYTIVDRQGITIQRDPYTRKPLVEFFTRKRTGGGVTNFQAIKLGIISA